MADADKLAQRVATHKTALDLLTGKNAKLDYIIFTADVPLAQKVDLERYAGV